MKYSLLIVDDEPAIREGIQTLIEWERLGIEVVGLATDGVEGLRLFRELSPDLMLVDIRMPRMGGLELIDEIRRSGSACRILVLSGHADFVYAQQAIRSGIDGYLLKPVDEEELEQYVQRIVRSLDEEQRSEASADTTMNKLHEAALQMEGLPEPNEGELLFVSGGSSDPGALARMLSRAVETGGADDICCRLDEAAFSLAVNYADRPAFASAMAELITLTLGELARHGNALDQGHQSALAASVYRHSKWSGMRAELAAGLAAVQKALDVSDSGGVLRRMTGFIERHYGEPLRLETLAELFGYNSGYLGKLFKSHTGVSFNIYLDQLRIEKAIAMLESGMKVRQAAEQVGYANVDYFHAKFKKYTGKSPSSYKKSGEG